MPSFISSLHKSMKMKRNTFYKFIKYTKSMHEQNLQMPSQLSRGKVNKTITSILFVILMA